MSKFWIYLKTNIRADLKQVHIIAAMFLFLPLFFTLLMGFSYSSAFVPEDTLEPIQINVQNDDEGEVGGILFETLSSALMEEYIEVVEEVDADFNLRIHPGYSEHFEDTLITIETKENSSTSEEYVLKQLIMEWQQAIVDQEKLMQEIVSIDNPKVINNLQSSLENLSEMNLGTIFSVETYHSKTALTSNQFTSVTGVMYILFMTLSGAVGMSTNKDLKGVRKRLGVIPLSSKDTILFEVGTNTIMYTVILLIYLIIWRLIDANTFVGNPLFYLFWIVIYTFFFQTINSALQYIVPDKLSNVFYQSVFMIYMVFGFLPIERMVGGELGEFFSQNFIREIFNQPFYDFMLTQQFQGNLPIALGLMISSFVIITVTVAIKQRRELLPA